MNKGVKFRIYPNKDQKALFAKTFGCCRLIYNKGISLRDEAFKNGGKAGYKETSRMLTDLKRQEEFAFLKNVDSISLQQSLRDLDRAFVNFFEKRSEHPKYKSKHDGHQSYRTINQGNTVCIVWKYIKLPKYGYVKIKQSMEIGHINNVTIEKTPTGKYYAVLNVDFKPEPKPGKTGMIGIDVGIKSFYTDSNGIVTDNPKYLEKSSKKLAREQKRMSRKYKGSNNYKKQRVKVARVYEKVTNQRNDFLQKQSTMLVRENQIICIEDLHIKGMIRNHKLARSIASVSWSKFFDMLKYKALWYGSTLIRVSRFYASSQICSCCGYRNTLVKDLSVRKWECPNCHTIHDRDKNAALNILNNGLSLA